MSRSVPIRGESPPTSLQKLEILRLASGTSETVILTAEVYRGVLTHWAPRTELCTGNGCARCKKSYKLFWRGYGAALVFDRESKKWRPTVLEISERLEHDFNGLWCRGQVWTLTKDKDTKESRGKLSGKLVNQLDAAMLPHPVDIEVPLRTIWRVEEIPWGALNTVPKGVVVALVEIDPRADRTTRPAPEPSPATGQKIDPKQIIEELAKRARMPQPSTNGHAH